MQHENLIEKRDLYCLSYILQNDRMFFQTGYKVLQNQEKNGFIRCTKILFNGYDKLVYDISKYKSLDALMSVISPDAFISTIKNLLDVIIDVNNNGFLQFENIEISFDKIFVDTNNYKVYLIYLPINKTETTDDYNAFEKELKNNILNAATDNPNIMSPQLNGILQIINNELSSIEVIRDKLNKGGIALSRPVTSGLNTVSAPIVQNKDMQSTPQNAAVATPAIQSEPPKKKKHFALFSKENKKTKNENSLPPVTIQPQCEGGATEILDDNYYKDLTLIGVNTPQDFRIVISKPEFFIGKKADSVDACISFNNAVSRVHCKIITSNNEHFIIDLGSANGTYVNDYRLNLNQQMPIRQGDHIKLANSEFIIS